MDRVYHIIIPGSGLKTCVSLGEGGGIPLTTAQIFLKVVPYINKPKRVKGNRKERKGGGRRKEKREE
jgi:hypothetical protein